MSARLGGLAALDAIVLVLALLGIAPTAGLVAHAFLSIAALALWQRDGRAAALAPAIAGVMGPGPLMAALLLPRRARPPAAPVAPGERAEQRAAPPRLGLRMLDGRVPHADAGSIGSLFTILRHGRVPDRRAALETAVRGFTPALSPLLAAALTDDDQTIRALAAAAAARTVAKLAGAREALETAADAGDAAAGWQLVALLADHARHNALLSDTQRSHLIADALALVKRLPPAPGQRALADAVRTAAALDRRDGAALGRLPLTEPA